MVLLRPSKKLMGMEDGNTLISQKKTQRKMLFRSGDKASGAHMF
jgi:hypothetical protein